MSAFFSATAAALLRGGKVHAALLVGITFNDGRVQRLWTGMGRVRIGGEIYSGLGKLIGIDGLEGQFGTGGRAATFKLSGVDPKIMALAVDEADLVVGAKIECALQVFGDGALATEWAPIDDPIGLGRWIGDQVVFERAGPTQRIVSMTGVTLFENRSRPLASMYSDADQQRRFPDDRGGEFMAAMANKKLKWPHDLFA